MTKKFHLTAKEEELMELLWEQEKPMTSSEILAVPINRSWSDNYLPIMIKSLLKKGAIEVSGYVQCQTQYARQFKTSISKEQYIARLIIGRGMNTSSIPKVAVAMVEELEGNPTELINELETMIEEMRKRE